MLFLPSFTSDFLFLGSFKIFKSCGTFTWRTPTSSFVDVGVHLSPLTSLEAKAHRNSTATVRPSPLYPASFFPFQNYAVRNYPLRNTTPSNSGRRPRKFLDPSSLVLPHPYSPSGKGGTDDLQGDL